MNIEPLQPVSSIAELCERALHERRYGALVRVAAKTLGGESDTRRSATAFLRAEAESGDEQAVLALVNSLRSEV